MTSVLATLRDFVREPRPALTENVTFDRRLIAGLMAIAVLASYLDYSVPNRLAAACIGIAATYVLRWCRTHAVWVAVAIAVLFVLLSEWGATDSVFGFAMSATSLVTMYALSRWGSGREILLGSLVVVMASIYPTLGKGLRWTEILIFAFWSLYPLGFGLAARFHARDRQHTVAAARMSERHELARELHDTVAHHVSAITIQAQAARMIMATKPDTAREVLEIIEEEATRTLDEMRRMVSVLRNSGETAELRPQSGLDEITALTTSGGTGPKVQVTLSGQLDHLTPSVTSSLFRLAQEGVTNARRHAHRVTQISIEIDGSQDRVDLTVSDDGEPHGRASTPGFGLTGLAERATQLGGTFTAGPEVRGWVIRASLPTTMPS